MPSDNPQSTPFPTAVACSPLDDSRNPNHNRIGGFRVSKAPQQTTRPCRTCGHPIEAWGTHRCNLHTPPHAAPAGPQMVCWICGYSAEERRKEVKGGECRTAAEFGKRANRCLMNSPEEVAYAE